MSCVPFRARTRSLAVAALSLGAAAGVTVANEWKVTEDHDWCDDSWRGAYCEVREIDLKARDLVRVDAAHNGGIEVRGWDKDTIKVYAKIQVSRDWGRDAPEIAGEIDISVDDVIEPDARRREGWSVSFRIYVPAESDLDLRAYNGGISIDGVHGELEFETYNGGIRLVDTAGDINGFTHNGGLDVELGGSTWNGEGLNLETKNGGISLVVPEDYSARLISGTVNGGFEIDFPVTVRGKVGKKVRATLGDGGPLIRVVTTNGGVRIYEG